MCWNIYALESPNKLHTDRNIFSVIVSMILKSKHWKHPQIFTTPLDYKLYFLIEPLFMLLLIIISFSFILTVWL